MFLIFLSPGRLSIIEPRFNYPFYERKYLNLELNLELLPPSIINHSPLTITIP